MRRLMAALIAVALHTPIDAHAIVLFEESFESGSLVQWVGKDGTVSSHHGIIVDDPLQTDHALSFTAVEQAGDIFTFESFSSDTGTYFLAFDYLGDPTQGGEPDDLGGYIGYSVGGYGSAPHDWLAGTLAQGGTVRTPADILPDDGDWHRIIIEFQSLLGDPLHLMLEDCCPVNDRPGSRIAGDVYFDNIILATSMDDLATIPIPEPATLVLIVLGLSAAGFAMQRPLKELHEN